MSVVASVLTSVSTSAMRFQDDWAAAFVDRNLSAQEAGKCRAVARFFPSEHRDKFLAVGIVDSSPENRGLSASQSFGLSLSKEPAALAKFLEAFDWVLSEIKKVEDGAATPS